MLQGLKLRLRLLLSRLGLVDSRTWRVAAVACRPCTPRRALLGFLLLSVLIIAFRWKLVCSNYEVRGYVGKRINR